MGPLHLSPAFPSEEIWSDPPSRTDVRKAEAVEWVRARGQGSRVISFAGCHCFRPTLYRQEPLTG